MDKFKRLLENEYIEMVITTILIIAVVFGFWYGSQFVLNTPHPALAVVSTSMLPTLNVGDLIIVQGINPAQINANYTTGDVVVFEHPATGDRIVHRAVKLENRSNGYQITTHGDNNHRSSEESFHESYLIGKVVAKIPYIGNFTLFIQALGDIYFVILVIILAAVFLVFSFSAESKEKSTGERQRHGKRRLFGRLNIEIVYLLIQNTLIISFMLFNLWGALTFWQPGADPPQYAAIRGVYSDLQYHESTRFKNIHNNISEAYLYQSFLTYKIDCLVDGAIRSGVLAFSWMQVSVLIFMVLNLWTLVKYLRSRKKTEPEN
jgi:signal peptidase I